MPFSIDFACVAPEGAAEHAFFEAFKKTDTVLYDWSSDIISVPDLYPQHAQGHTTEILFMRGPFFIARTHVPVVTSAHMVLMLLCNNKRVEVEKCYKSKETIADLTERICDVARTILSHDPPLLLMWRGSALHPFKYPNWFQEKTTEHKEE